MPSTEQTLGLILGKLAGVEKRLDDDREERVGRNGKIDNAIAHFDALQLRVDTMEPVVSMIITKRAQISGAAIVLGVVGVLALMGGRDAWEFLARRIGG